MRLVTRGDLDGLTCAVLLTLNEDVNGISLIHPQDITDGRADIRPVYKYYGGEAAMPQFKELVQETDRLDSANLTPDDVLAPEGYIKLGFTIDGRTGMGTFESYFLHLVDLLKIGTPIEHVLSDPGVKRRCDILDSENERFIEELKACSRVEGNVVVTDFRSLDHVPIGNRFLVYAIYPDVNVSVRVHWGPNREFPMLLVGHSIFNRTCRTNVGELAARYGGGGHKGAGSIPLMDEPDQQIRMVTGELKANG